MKSKLFQTRPVEIRSATAGAGVYAVRCGECPEVYIGETGRDYKVRLKEHQNNVRFCKERSAVYNHMLKSNHAIDWSNSRLLYHSNNVKRRLAVESALISRVPNFNNMPGVSTIDKLSTNLILSSNPAI